VATERRKVLAIDGGGVRGVIPLCQLVALEEATGQLTRETFDFVAGTSAGAVITAGIVAGIPAARILQLFNDLAGQIFTQWPWNLLKRIVPGYMYSTLQLNKVLRVQLGTAGCWTLNDTHHDLLITAVRLSDGKPWYFVPDNRKNSGRTGHLSLADCVTASAAAPTYFAPWLMPEDPAELGPGDTPIGTLVDGGVSATGNPVYQACVEAFYYTGEYSPGETLVVSLGTGRYLDRSRPRWIGGWLTWLLAELLRSPGEQQTEIVRRHFPDTPCYRLNPPLPVDIAVDSVSHLAQLRAIGDRFAATVDWPAILAGATSPFLS